MTSPDSVLTGSYDHILVALSVLIAILASYAALDLARHVTSAQGRARLLWLTGGANAMGFGIWSMHYIGMLAFRLPIPVQYDWPTVLLSLLAAILASAIALFVVSRSRMGVIRAVLGSIFMGGGIATMHYTGMAAMRLPAICSYSTGLVTLSVLLAIVISLVALFLTFYFRGDTTAWSWRKMLSAMVMGAAIPVMHYTAMAAASFTPSNSDHHDLSHAVSVSSLGVAGICIVTFVVLGTYLLTSLRFDAVSTGSSVLSGLFYQRATLVLTVVVVITSAGMLWQLNRLQTNLVRAMALQGSFLQSQTIAALRSMYTSEVVERVRPLGIEATGDYKEKRGAIPLPATFTIELGQHIHESGSGMDMRLYSDYPFPWRKDGGPQDAFEREALIRLRENPDVPFFRMESLRGTMVIRYATADRMRKQCLDCHNNHPASPKRDWLSASYTGLLPSWSSKSQTAREPNSIWRNVRKSWRAPTRSSNCSLMWPRTTSRNHSAWLQAIHSFWPGATWESSVARRTSLSALPWMARHGCNNSFRTCCLIPVSRPKERRSISRKPRWPATPPLKICTRPSRNQTPRSALKLCQASSPIPRS